MLVLVFDDSRYHIRHLEALSNQGIEFTQDAMGNADALIPPETYMTERFSDEELAEMETSGILPVNWADARAFLTQGDYDWWVWYFHAESLIENKIKELTDEGNPPNEQELSDCYQADYETSMYNLADLLGIDIPSAP